MFVIFFFDLTNEIQILTEKLIQTNPDDIKMFHIFFQSSQYLFFIVNELLYLFQVHNIILI